MEDPEDLKVGEEVEVHQAVVGVLIEVAVEEVLIMVEVEEANRVVEEVEVAS